jgi:hypothetical protein
MNIKIHLQKNKFKILGAAVLILFGIFGRFFRIYFLPDLYNVEPITFATLLAGALLGGGWGLFVPLSIVAITDIFLGNSPILYFTWSAWATIGLSGLILRKSKKEKFSFGFKMTALGIGASLFFYLWTNFGVWLLGDLYPKTFEGLVLCYIMGLPFLKLNLLGNLVIISVGSFWLVIILRVYQVLKVHKIHKVCKVKNYNNC